MPHLIPHGLYGFADATWPDPLRQAQILADEGVLTIQLRCKNWPEDELRKLALVCMNLGPMIILNDRPALARELGLGAHVGQEDGGDPEDIFFGRSTHDLQQAKNPGQAFYIGFGPIFSSTTKAGVKTARGVDLLAQAVQIAPVPVVAIGGIDTENLEYVKATGVHAWAVIGAIWGASDPQAVIRKLR